MIDEEINLIAQVAGLDLGQATTDDQEKAQRTIIRLSRQLLEARAILAEQCLDDEYPLLDWPTGSHTRGCWCPMAIDHPGFGHHTDECNRADDFLSGRFTSES